MGPEWPPEDRPPGRPEIIRCTCQPMCSGWGAHDEKMRRQAGPAATPWSVPTVEITEDGHLAITFVRQRDHDKVVSITVHRGAKLEWFYRNRLTNEIRGTVDEPSEVLGPEFWKSLKEFE